MMNHFWLACAGHGLLAWLFFWWTGRPDETAGQVALSFAVAVGWLAFLVLLERRLFAGSRWMAALARWPFWASVLLFGAACFTAWLILSWIPKVSGLTMQLFSLAARLTLGWALVNLAWVNIARQASLPPAEHRRSSVAGHESPHS